MADDKSKKLEDEELMNKKVAYYSVMFTAFIESRNEIDRHILTLSVACIGGLFAFQGSHNKTVAELVLTMIALIGFIVTIGLILYILIKNSEYIKNELSSDTAAAIKASEELKRLDRLTSLIFICSIVISSAVITLDFFSRTI